MDEYNEFVHILRRIETTHVQVIEHELPGWLERAIRNAARAAGPDKTPMIVLHPRNKPWEEGLVITMRSLPALASEMLAALEAQEPDLVAEVRNELDNGPTASK